MSRPQPIVIGRSGQLARALFEAAATDAAPPVFLGRPDFDILSGSGTWQALDRGIDTARTAGLVPVIINTAAYTDVRQAETASQSARALNTVAAGRLAEHCAGTRTCLIHVSTDYVFSGDAAHPYREDDPTGPGTVYGQTKLDGEHAVRAAGDDHLIVRTAWLFSPFGHNFLKTMHRLAREGVSPQVVNDQAGCPTSAIDLASALLEMSRQVAAGAACRGTYHYCGRDIVTWHEFAVRIFRAASGEAAAGRVRAISAAEYDAAMDRPAYSALDCRAIADAFGIEQPVLDAAIARDLARLTVR